MRWKEELASSSDKREDGDADPPPEETEATDESRPRITRHVMPLGPRVLVRLIPSEDRTSSGLILPAGARDAATSVAYAEVVEVARAAPDDEDEGFGRNVSGVPHGSRILFVKEKGLAVPWDDKLRVVLVKDVIALVDEIELDEAH
ncbi:MAG: co-chaperone GroES [Myxococcota bacterium]